MTWRAAIAATVGLLLAPAAAHAKCARSQAFLSPGSGAVLPPDPAIYLFVPGRVAENAPLPAVDLAVDGSAVAGQVELVSIVTAFAAYRVTIARKAPGTLDVKVVLTQPFARVLDARYTIGEPASTTARPVPGIEPAQRQISQWMCSFQDTWNLPPTVDAPAYRVEWAHSRSRYDTGPRDAAVFPRNPSSFFRPGDTSAAPLVKLGAVSCLGTTLQWPSTPVWVGVSALLADGTEIPLTDDPLELRKP